VLLQKTYGLKGFVVDLINKRHEDGLMGGKLGTADEICQAYKEKTGKTRTTQAVYTFITRMNDKGIIRVYHKSNKIPVVYYWKVCEGVAKISPPPWSKPKKDYRIIGLGLITEIENLLNQWDDRWEPLDNLLNKYKKELDQ